MEKYYGLFVIGIALNYIFGSICSDMLIAKGYGETEDYKNHGFWWGFFLGVIGIIVCALKPDLNLVSYRSHTSAESDKDAEDNQPNDNDNQTIEQIKEYKKLLDDGAITEEEYNQIKKNILDLP